MRLVCGLNQSHYFILFTCMWVEMTVTRLRTSKYILVQLNLLVVHLECGFNQTTISYYLFVNKKGSDGTAHMQIYNFKFARGASRMWH